MNGFTAQAEKVLNRVIEGKLSKAGASRKLKVSRNTIYKWLRVYEVRLKDRKVRKSLRENKREKYLKKIIRIVVANPSFGPSKIASELTKRGWKISNRSVWLALKEKNLQSKDKRENYSYNFKKLIKAKDPSFPGHLRLQSQARKRMVEEALLTGTKVGEVTKKYGVSRKTYSKWKERYQYAIKDNRSILKALSDQNPRGTNHPRGVSESTEKKVLENVALYPELSSAKLAEKLSFVGNHGVQNILNRNNFNTYELRLAYSKAQQLAPKPIYAKMLDRIRLVWEQFIPSRAPAPPPKLSRAFYSLRTFAITSVFTLAITYSLFTWFEFLTSQTPVVVLGLFFASIALFMGSLFFLYSLKYYITLAIVLSFSQQEGSKPGEFSARKGLLSWFLGLNNRNPGISQAQDDTKKSIGLTPSFEHMNLKREPFVSVHIPLFNEKKVVERAIKAASNFDYPEYEVILADDSTDDTTGIIRKYQKSLGDPKITRGVDWVLTEVEVKPGVTLKHLHRTTRSGYKGGALKLALSVCDPRTEFVSVFDADFVPYPDTLELFLKYFQATTGTLDFKKGSSENSSKPYTLKPKTSNIAAVQGYQWHVLNKSENWITRGVRSEYAGSYVVERSGEEIYGGLKQISGAVYMIRRDVLEEVGWETSITEDFQLTLKLYERGYKVVYTPYIQAPAECVSTIQRLIKQRMRWAEGHSNNIRKMFPRVLFNKNLSTAEKLEFLYLSPYYLQAFFFLVGTLAWLISETLFPARLPFWTSLWGWSLVLTNILALPLMNSVGLFLEESEERDYQGILSFIALTYILVPFQAYASIKGFLEKEEGPWFRTPKTGRITDVFTRGRFYRFISGIIPGRAQPAVAKAMQFRFEGPRFTNKYLALSTANNSFNSFSIIPKRKRRFGRILFVFVLSMSVLVHSMAFNAQPVEAAWHADTNYLYRKSLTLDSTLVSGTANLTNFPTLVSYSDTDLRTTGDGGRVTNSSGFDIVFTASDEETVLDHEIESYTSNGTTGTIVMWVRVTTLDYDDDTVIYIYYGNSSISASQEDIPGTWDTNYKMVQHLNETTGTHLDSTSNDNDSTAVTVTTQGSATGQIDGADDFDGLDDMVTIADAASLDITGNLTVEAWVDTDFSATNTALASDVTLDIGEKTESTVPAVYDMDDDGDEEIMVPDSNAGSFWVFDHSGSALTVEDNDDTLPKSKSSPTVADVDDDGDLEAIMIDANSGSIIVYGYSSGTLSIEDSDTNIAKTEGGAPAVGDVDNDGNLEIVTADGNDGLTTVWEHNGTTLTQEASAGDPGKVKSGVSLADLDDDGTLEMVVVDSAPSGLFVMSDDGDATLTLEASDSSVAKFEVAAPMIADFDNDGTLEIAVVDSNTGILTVHSHNGSSLTKEANTGALGKTKGAMAAADVDNDGTIEIVFADGNTGTVYVYNHDGDSLQQEDTDTGSGKVDKGSLAIVDLDGDGTLEITYVDGADGTLLVYRHDGTTLTLETSAATGTLAKAGVAVADLDDDGYLEIVWPNGAQPSILTAYRVTNGTKGDTWRQYGYDERNTYYKPLPWAVTNKEDAYGVFVGTSTAVGTLNGQGGVSRATAAGFNHVAFTNDGTNRKIYVDGVVTSEAFTTSIATNSASLLIGDLFDGIVDEVRISNSARSADWIDTEFENQDNQGTGTGKFIKTLGSEEEVSELVLLLIPLALAMPVIIKYLRRKNAYARTIN